jgi:hypothetical protein
MRYALGGRCSRLTAKVGIDDEVWSNGSVTFEVWGDGTKLYDSGRMTGASPTATVDVALAGRSELRLVVTGAGDGIAYDHGNWADARITCGTAQAGSAPVPRIDLPASSVRFKVGDTITFAGGATDAEDGTIPASGLSWQITLQHCSSGNCHAHPLTTVQGAGGSFEVPDHGDQIEFTLALTATDSSGRKTTTTHTVLPQLVQLTLDTSPTGLDVVNGGERAVAPMVRTVVAGSRHTILAPSPQGDRVFSSWSDGGAGPARRDRRDHERHVHRHLQRHGGHDAADRDGHRARRGGDGRGGRRERHRNILGGDAGRVDHRHHGAADPSGLDHPRGRRGDVRRDHASRDARSHERARGGAQYTATVRSGATGVKDAAGNALAADRTWTFTTAAGGSDVNPPSSIGRAVVDGDILYPHAVVATPDGSIYAAEFGVYVASAGTPARRFVWKYTPNGSGAIRRRGWRGRRMVRRVVMGRRVVVW